MAKQVSLSSHDELLFKLSQLGVVRAKKHDTRILGRSLHFLQRFKNLHSGILVNSDTQKVTHVRSAHRSSSETLPKQYFATLFKQPPQPP